MTFNTGWRSPRWAHDRTYGLGHAPPQRLLGGAGVIFVASLCALTLCAIFSGSNTSAALAVPESAPHSSLSRSGPAPAAFAARFYLGPEGKFSMAAPLRSEEELAYASPLSDNPPEPRYTLASLPPSANPPAPEATEQTHRLARDWRLRLEPRGRHHPMLAARDEPQERVAAAAPREPSIWEKLFGKRPSVFDKLFGASPSGVTLAYATAGNATDGAGVTAGLYDRQTAVYDISAHKVYMPDGTTLEAHSGLGERLDDPRYVDERGRGATPPDVYDLRPREAPFHGVRALRLIPVDESKVFGRAGLLAHTYMLGPNGDSNGCVSFRDYDAFLRAYESGEIKRLAVVSSID
jgi:Protein of unknown function (DUF2778)